MNREKISDFVDIWANAVGLTEKAYINVIKSDIAKRCKMYEDKYIDAQIDNCDAYIIKPVNGKYSMEDFFLNRLMLGLRNVDFTGAIEGNGGEYTAQHKSLNVNVGLLNYKINEKSTRHQGLVGKNIKIIKKTIEHELGHCFKSSFTNGYKAPIGEGRSQDTIYESIISNLQKYKNGLYSNQIKTVQELNKEESNSLKTGINDSEVIYGYDYRLQWIDELLNETEALQLTNSNEIQEIYELLDEQGQKSSTGNYVNVFNYMSGYRSFTGYGSILKSILGKDDTFYAEYISSKEILKKFDEEYSDIVYDVWKLNPNKMTPLKCLFVDFDDLVHRKSFNENIMLKLDEFLAKCYERKIDKILRQNNGNLNEKDKEQIKNHIQLFQTKLTTNNDPQKREQLAHNIVFSRIKQKIEEKEMQEEAGQNQKDDETLYKTRTINRGLMQTYQNMQISQEDTNKSYQTLQKIKSEQEQVK